MIGLDQDVLRLALRDARKLVASGIDPERAATVATPGAWASYRAEVLRLLLAAGGEPPRS